MVKSIGVALLCGSSVSAVIGAPEKIVVKPDGKFIIIDDGLGQDNDLREITQLPVYSEGPGGELLPGIYYSGTSKTGNHVWPLPVWLVVNSDGTYSIETAYWSMSHGPKGTLRDHLVPGSEFVRVRHDIEIDDRAEVDNYGRGSGAVIWGGYQPGITSPAAEVPGDVAVSISHALSVWENLLELDPRVFQQFNFYWDDFSSIPDPDERDAARNSVVAFASIVRVFSLDVSTLFTYLNNDYSGQTEEHDDYEEDIYDFLPLGVVKYEADLGTIESINSDIVFSLFHIENIDGPASSNPPQAAVGMNPFLYSDFDFDPSDGIGEDRIDFRGTLVHEIGHHFGFMSTMDLRLNGQTLSDPRLEHPSMLDVFRFEDAAAGVPNPLVFQTTGVRDLVLNDASAAVLQLSDQSWFTPLSYGELIPGTTDSYFQPSHWRINLTQPEDQIGIMAPTHPNGLDTRVYGSYFSPEDVRIFDLLGYRINYEDHAFVQLPVPVTPLNDHLVDPGNSILFDWTAGSSVTRSDFMIYDLGPVTESHLAEIPNETMVYRQNDATTGTEITISTGELSLVPGHRYQWHVATYHPLGVALSDPSTFIVQGSPPEPKPCGPLNESAKLLGPSGGYNYAELGYDVAIDGDWAAAGSPVYKDSEQLAGRVEIYKQDGSLWRHHQTILSPDAYPGDWFGTAVDIDGDYMVIGAASARHISDGNTDYGLAYIYELMNDEWVYMATLTPGDASSTNADHFGISAEISGNRVLVGAPYHQPNGGSAYLYELDQGVWSQTHQFFPIPEGFSNESTNNWFGWSVSLDGDRIAVGSYRDEVEDGVSSGSVTTYAFDGISWQTSGKMYRLFTDGARNDDRFGFSVSLSGDTLVVGAPKATGGWGQNSGLLFAYDWAGTQWSLPQELDVPINTTSFGFDVSVQGDILVAGADFANGQDGDAYMFRRPNGSWEYAHELKRTDEDSTIMNGARFGNAVDTDAGRVIGGATYASTVPGSSGASRGAAYIHEVRACLADINDDGQLNFFDVSQYLTWNSDGDLRADWNCDGVLNFFDYSKFLEYYNAGCP
jgi:hypothetical protein